MKRKAQQPEPVRFPPHDLLTAREFVILKHLARGYQLPQNGGLIRSNIHWPPGKSWLTQFYRHMTELTNRKLVKTYPGECVANGTAYKITDKGLIMLQQTQEFYS